MTRHTGRSWVPVGLLSGVCLCSWALWGCAAGDDGDGSGGGTASGGSSSGGMAGAGAASGGTSSGGSAGSGGGAGAAGAAGSAGADGGSCEPVKAFCGTKPSDLLECCKPLECAFDPSDFKYYCCKSANQPCGGDTECCKGLFCKAAASGMTCQK